MDKKSAILCLDDDELVLETLEYQLQKRFGEQFYYEFALDPLEALETLDQLNRERIPLFLVISDWLMPEMNGDQFLSKVQDLYPGSLKVLLTGKTEEDTLDLEAFDLFGFLYKPWDEKSLISMVQKAQNNFQG